MKINKYSDTLLNVIFPVALACFIYLLSSVTEIHLLIKNYFPDGLWAYSFLSALLIVWSRQVNFLWILIGFSLSAGFELLQHFHWIAGTGDIIDIVVYFVFFGVGFIVNTFFKNLYSVHTGKVFNRAHEKQ